MAKLLLHGQEVETVFNLLGSSENAMTYSLGWALAKCNSFCQSLATLLGVAGGFSDALHIRLQDYSKGKGFTDIELIDPTKYHIIIEAKRGFTVPSIGQLEKYTNRLLANNDTKAQKMLVVLAESDRDEQWLPQQIPSSIKKVPIKTISWKKIQQAAQQSILSENYKGKKLLNELIQYLMEVTIMQNQNSNLVYVVSLSKSKSPLKGEISFIDVVEKHGKYFHPVGGGRGRYPIEPPKITLHSAIMVRCSLSTMWNLTL